MCSDRLFAHTGLLCLCILVSSCGGRSDIDDVTAGVNKLSFHNDRQRTGWNRHERVLTPAVVSGPGFGLIWESPPLDTFAEEAPRLFASPLFVNSVEISAGPHRGSNVPVTYAASGTGYVYAISAEVDGAVTAGTILWSRRLTAMPCRNGRMGILGTPVIDLDSGRLYVVSCDMEQAFKAYALDFESGEIEEGWPVDINHLTVNGSGINNNGSTQFPEEHTLLLQRGALNLSHDASRLYVPFGKDAVSGWMVVVDTGNGEVVSAFSSTAKTEEHQGGMWATAGPSVDPEGRVHIATGASVVFASRNAGTAGVFPDSEHNWGQSIIQWSDGPEAGLQLTGTYTPFDYCRAQAADIDLGGSGTIVIDLDPALTGTPRLLALIGGKQGNAYLLDRDRMPGSLVKRPPCSGDSMTDQSLLSPQEQPHFGQPGPINVFGPYSADLGWFDHAKSRTTAAYYQGSDRAHYLYATGNTKAEVDSPVSIPPSLARLRIITTPGEPAYLAIDELEKTLLFKSPGSPVISSNGHQDAIVWVLDKNAGRMTSLWDEENAPQPILYALDAMTLELLWHSAEGELYTSGVYNEPAVVNGMVLVGTDRIQAYGLR